MSTGLPLQGGETRASSFRSAFSAENSERGTPRQRTLVLASLCTFVVLLASLRGATRPLWFDEIVTADIAGAQSWHGMLLRSRAIDLHPPLEPALVRLSFGLFGPHEFGAHLPSVLAFTIAVASLFVFLSRRVPFVFAAAGALLPLADAEVAYYSVEARPYALLFGAASLGLLAYDTVLRSEVHSRRLTAWRLVLAFSIVVLLQAHLFGTLAAVCFFVVEAFRTIRLRRFDWQTWAAVALPWLSCITYVALLRNQAGAAGSGSSGGSGLIYELKDRVSLLHGLGFYHGFLYLPLAPLLKVLLVVLVLAPFFPGKSFFRYAGVTPELSLLLLLLLLMPISVTVLLKLKAPGSGFFPRYSIVAVAPAFILLTVGFAWRAVNSRGLAWVFLLGVLLTCAASFSDLPTGLGTLDPAHPFAAPRGVASTGGVDRICPGLPLVVDNPLQFLESDNRLPPETMGRMVYLYDSAEALRLEHHNSSEAVGAITTVFERPRHAVPGLPFLATHPHLLLLMRPRKPGWVSDELKEKHASLEDLGRYRFTGENLTLALVSQDGTAPPPDAGCAASTLSPH